MTQYLWLSSKHSFVNTVRENLQRKRERTANFGKKDGANILRSQVLHKFEQAIRPKEVSLSPVERKLEQLSEGKYYSPERIDWLLREFSHGTVWLSSREMNRLHSKIPKVLTSAHLEGIQTLRSHTENFTAPIILQIPWYFIVDMKEIPFTLENFRAVWERGYARESIDQGIFFWGYVSSYTKKKHWTDASVQAFSTGCISRSKNCSYETQVRTQENFFGTGGWVDESLFIALAFGYLDTRSTAWLITSDVVRVNVSGSDGKPLGIDFDAGVFSIHGSGDEAQSECWIGASFLISA